MGDGYANLGRLTRDEQVAVLRSVLSRNETLLDVLTHASQFDLPGWYLTGGCVFQTVWNIVTGHAPDSGISDYDLFYFDNSDLSWEAEDAVIRRGDLVFADVDAVVEIRNEARVHLWYEQRFGVACPPHTSTESAIDSFAATTCCVGIRMTGDGEWITYAPHGLSDVFNLILRPNPVQAPRAVYEVKAAKWQQKWPQLDVYSWPDEHMTSDRK